MPLPGMLGGIVAAFAVLAPLAAFTADIPASERRSGYEFMGRETRAMQDDDAANPGMLAVLDGEALWNRGEGPAGKSCASCHGDARASMNGVAARYPAFEAALGRPVDLEQRINLCRTDRQQTAPLPFESRDLLALTAFVAHRSKGQPIAVAGRSANPPVRRCRQSDFRAPAGPAEPVLRAMPRRQLGAKAWRRGDTAGPSHRLPALSPGMAEPRLAAAAAAQLPDRHARRALSQRRAGDRRARTLSRLARPWSRDGDTRRAPLKRTGAGEVRRRVTATAGRGG